MADVQPIISSHIRRVDPNQKKQILNRKFRIEA
jgi:hypothetical protein